MEGLSLESRRIAGKASEPPRAIKEPWGREAAPRLADGMAAMNGRSVAASSAMRCSNASVT
jgi:hypothetical protein